MPDVDAKQGILQHVISKVSSLVQKKLNCVVQRAIAIVTLDFKIFYLKLIFSLGFSTVVAFNFCFS